MKQTGCIHCRGYLPADQFHAGERKDCDLEASEEAHEFLRKEAIMAPEVGEAGGSGGRLEADEDHDQPDANQGPNGGKFKASN